MRIYPAVVIMRLHLGLTEAGMGSKGIVSSAAALSVLMQQGIGDTIRISLTPEPGASRTQEVIVGQEILQTMGFRSFTPMVISCPGCGRTTSDYFQKLAMDIQTYLRDQMPDGARNILVLKPWKLRLWAAWSMVQEKVKAPISVSAYRVQANLL